jgi:hypothetical protein
MQRMSRVRIWRQRCNVRRVTLVRPIRVVTTCVCVCDVLLSYKYSIVLFCLSSAQALSMQVGDCRLHTATVDEFRFSSLL